MSQESKNLKNKKYWGSKCKEKKLWWEVEKKKSS